MVYLEYEKTTKQVVQIHEVIPTVERNYDYVKSDTFVLGDEFEKNIFINEINEEKEVVSFAVIRNNPNAQRLLRENAELKIENETMSNYLLDVDFRLVLIELDI